MLRLVCIVYNMLGIECDELLLQALQQPDEEALTVNATAILVAAAVTASSPGAVAAAFAQVSFV